MKPENFKDHPVFEKLEQLHARLQEQELKEKIEIERFNFFDTVCNFIKVRLKLSIPVLVLDKELNELASEIASGLSEINNYIGNNNTGHLNNATNHFNSAINRIRNFPLMISETSYDFLTVVADFQSILNEKYVHNEKENEKRKAEINELSKQLDTKRNEIDKLTKLLAQKEAEIQSINNSFKTELSSIKSTAVQAFERDREKYKKEFETDRATYDKQIEEQIKSIINQTTNLVKELNTKLEESKKLVNIIGNVGFTGNYQKLANHHRKQANIWRIIAVLFMIVLSGSLIYTIWQITGEQFEWEVSLVRVIAFSALLYPATYTAKEAAKHRRLENANRKSELDLASINAFIEILPDQKKQEIKEKLVDKFFGNRDAEEDLKRANEDELSVSGFEKLIKALTAFVKK